MGPPPNEYPPMMPPGPPGANPNVMYAPAPGQQVVYAQGPPPGYGTPPPGYGTPPPGQMVYGAPPGAQVMYAQAPPPQQVVYAQAPPQQQVVYAQPANAPMLSLNVNSVRLGNLSLGPGFATTSSGPQQMQQMQQVQQQPVMMAPQGPQQMQAARKVSFFNAATKRYLVVEDNTVGIAKEIGDGFHKSKKSHKGHFVIEERGGFSTLMTCHMKFLSCNNWGLVWETDKFDADCMWQVVPHPERNNEVHVRAKGGKYIGVRNNQARAFNECSQFELFIMTVLPP